MGGWTFINQMIYYRSLRCTHQNVCRLMVIKNYVVTSLNQIYVTRLTIHCCVESANVYWTECYDNCGLFFMIVHYHHKYKYQQRFKIRIFKLDIMLIERCFLQIRIVSKGEKHHLDAKGNPTWPEEKALISYITYDVIRENLIEQQLVNFSVYLVAW